MAKIERSKLRTEVTEADLTAICTAIIGGATYAAAAMAVGVRTSALRLLKWAEPRVARSLRAAWLEQGRRLRTARQE
jgi:hypothetical protein